MSDRVTHRLSAEGVDPLGLTGVNDENLIALEKQSGASAALRGDQLNLAGEATAVELAASIALQMIEMVRIDGTVSHHDIARMAAGGDPIPDGGNDVLIKLPGIRKPVRPKTVGQMKYVRRMLEDDIVVGIGPAGTGKTYLAVAMAVDALARKRVARIVLARPAVEAGERLGFLPGDLQAKVDPYLRPLYDALETMMPVERMQRAIETRTIEIAPLAYMRGRTLQDAFIILDEAQNVTGGQMKMFLTRMGVNSQAVVIGDKTQVDLQGKDESGLGQVERILPGIEGTSICYLDDTDVVRHRLVREIILAYDQDESE